MKWSRLTIYFFSRNNYNNNKQPRNYGLGNNIIAVCTTKTARGFIPRKKCNLFDLFSGGKFFFIFFDKYINIT